MQLDREQINMLVEAVAAKLSGGMTRTGVPVRDSTSLPKTSQTLPQAVAIPASSSRVAYATLDQAVAAAKSAQTKWVALNMEKRKQIINRLREKLRAHVEELSRLAVDETR